MIGRNQCSKETIFLKKIFAHCWFVQDEELWFMQQRHSQRSPPLLAAAHVLQRPCPKPQKKELKRARKQFNFSLFFFQFTLKASPETS